MTAKNTVAPIVLEYLINHQGQVVTVQAIAEATGLTPQQVGPGMYRIVRDRKWPVETIQQGQMWRVGRDDTDSTQPVADPGTVTFHKVEQAGDTVMLLAAPDGALWLAKRIGKAEQ